MVCLATAQAVVSFGLGMLQTWPLPDEILNNQLQRGSSGVRLLSLELIIPFFLIPLHFALMKSIH